MDVFNDYVSLEVCTIIFNPKKVMGLIHPPFKRDMNLTIPDLPYHLEHNVVVISCGSTFFLFFPGRSGSALTTIPVAIEYGIFQQAQEETTPKSSKFIFKNLSFGISMFQSS